MIKKIVLDHFDLLNFLDLLVLLDLLKLLDLLNLRDLSDLLELTDLLDLMDFIGLIYVLDPLHFCRHPKRPRPARLSRSPAMPEPKRPPYLLNIHTYQTAHNSKTLKIS